MNDRELIEMAAKAARFYVCTDLDFLGMEEFGPDLWVKSEKYGNYFGWNPLTNDGDALRLAVKLGMNIEITDSTVFACSRGNFYEDAKPSPEAATRRAIVRAAAEIGRIMP